MTCSKYNGPTCEEFFYQLCVISCAPPETRCTWGLPPTSESPSLSQPKFMLFGAQAPPRPEDLPRPCCKLLCNTVRDSTTGSVGHQRTSITTLDSCGPGAWTTPDKLFTPALPSVDKYKPEYYRGGHIRPLVQGDLWPSLFLLLSFKKRGESQVAPPLHCRSVVGGRTTPGFHGLLGHMVFKR
jgi:hypothetical protein